MADVDALVALLTLDEKAHLLAGADLWSTVAVERLRIPKVLLSDGPNGVRGATLTDGTPAVCIPCGSALGATWDPSLVQRLGELLGREARAEGVRVLLAPTVNIHRSPLAGRNFECYSEDPLLTGQLAAAFVRGAQSQGVATTVKHLVGNEAETDRYVSDSIVDERTLREIYLLPFELAVRGGGALGVMTAYNRLNGQWCADRSDLLDAVLRDEWGFEGFVVSDWYAAVDTVRACRAGLDLEMPGPGRAYGDALLAAVERGELTAADLDHPVRRLLTVFDHIGALDDLGEPVPPRSDDPDDRALARAAAAAAMVLLRNDDILPLEPARLGRVAVVGPLAARAQIMGGGSAAVRPHDAPGPLDALRGALGPDVEVVHARGCDIRRSVPALRAPFRVTIHAGTDLAEPAVAERDTSEGRLLFLGPPAPGVTEPWSLRASATFVPDESGPWTFTLVQAGRARLRVDGAIVLDGHIDPPPPGEEFFGLGSAEMATTIALTAGRAVDVVVELTSEGAAFLCGVKVGCAPPVRDDLLDEAVRAAADADVAVVCVGTTDEWESEGFDRSTLDLPGAQDELIERILDVQPRTIVVVNTGLPVAMPWASRAAAVLQAWFGGQEHGPALADVLTGAVEPGGRLPTTIPLALEHTPSFGQFPGEHGAVRYGEGLLVGYRWYDSRRLPVQFPFGHGLGYTTVELTEPRVEHTTITEGEEVVVRVDVTNTGSRRGSEVVQLYVEPLDPTVTRPRRELKTFAKVDLEPGERRTVALVLDRRSFAHWSPGQPDWPALAPRLRHLPGGRVDTERDTEPGWRVTPGRFRIHVGRSIADLPHHVDLDVVTGASP